MPILKSLTFTAVPARSHDPVANRRAKLVEPPGGAAPAAAEPVVRPHRPAMDRQGRRAPPGREAAAGPALVARRRRRQPRDVGLLRHEADRVREGQGRHRRRVEGQAAGAHRRADRRREGRRARRPDGALGQAGRRAQGPPRGLIIGTGTGGLSVARAFTHQDNHHGQATRPPARHVRARRRPIRVAGPARLPRRAVAGPARRARRGGARAVDRPRPARQGAGRPEVGRRLRRRGVSGRSCT